MGHAVNKILKDIILKQKVLDSRRVHYKPGWDCHGLPIELKAVTSSRNLSPLQIRQKARKFALDTIQKQSKVFESLGIIGSWNDATQVYKTIDKDYIKNQLEVFHQMYQRGLIFRDMKPVFWSPSSKTALAEAELEYNDNFISPSLYFRCEITNATGLTDGKLYALIWTTTPWTLPANQAICFNKNLKYSIVNIQGDQYIIGIESIGKLRIEMECDIDVVREVDSHQLENLQYHHPINNEILPFFDGSHVQADKGTGLVHTAPSHGPDDFLIFLNRKIPLKCLVDESGCYNQNAPEFLQGKEVLGNGNQLVVNHLASNVMKLKELKHSYPIDWRTKQPVIILASDQWFVNTEMIKTKAAQEMETINIFPEKSMQVSKNVFKTQLEKRPYWCISRQRSWGMPIPVLYDANKQPIITDELLNYWTALVEETDGIDFWWERDVHQLLPKGTNLNPDEITKGTDILDIWFDSGISWSYALNGDKVADLYLEGVDQFTGWFQSSLMTSVAVRDIAPYRNIFVHGFAVDENGRKMSKSLGNVISPESIVKKYGVDVMRWWVAAHSTQHASVTVSHKLLEDGAKNLSKIRATFKYLVGVMDSESDGRIDIAQLAHLDKFILHQLDDFNQSISTCYNSYQFNRIIALVNNLVNTDLSSNYLHLIKDRLYCGYDTEHKTLQSVIYNCYHSLCKSLWPITPFLVEESWSYLKDQPFYQYNRQEAKWSFGKSQEIVNDSLIVKQKLSPMINDLNSWKTQVTIGARDQLLDNLKVKLFCWHFL